MFQLPLLALQVLLCIDPSPPWDLLSTFVLSLICYLVLTLSVLQVDTGVGLVNYLLGAITMSCAVNGFYLLLLAKPLRNFKCIGNGKGSAQSDRVWWEKYSDVARIICSPRLIGWSHQVKNIHLSPQKPRHSFVLHSILRAVWYAIFFEVGRLYVWYNPAYTPAAIGTQSYAVQNINAAVFIGLTYWFLNATYYIMAAGSVAIGLYHPGMWPDLFGDWRDAYTVRRLWGRTWHQLLRAYFSPLGKAISTAFGFKPGTLKSSYTQLYIAFFLSGLVHMGGDIALTFHTPAASWKFSSMPLFLIQAFIITLEEILIWVAKRSGVKHSVWTRVLGHVWVATWIGWCISEFVKGLIRAGGGIREPGMDSNAMDSNLVQFVLGFWGFDIGAFAESWFSKV